MQISMRAVVGVFLLLLLTIGIGMVGCPLYAVWSAEKQGEAELARAEQNRNIAVAQSRAKAEAAAYEAQAEITRAKGVATANQIIGNSLGGDTGEAYLRYLWINAMEGHNDKTVVYIPTEGNLPLLEANRFRVPAPPRPAP